MEPAKAASLEPCQAFIVGLMKGVAADCKGRYDQLKEGGSMNMITSGLAGKERDQICVGYLGDNDFLKQRVVGAAGETELRQICSFSSSRQTEKAGIQSRLKHGTLLKHHLAAPSRVLSMRMKEKLTASGEESSFAPRDSVSLIKLCQNRTREPRVETRDNEQRRIDPEEIKIEPEKMQVFRRARRQCERQRGEKDHADSATPSLKTQRAMSLPI